jgi:hypothetical protein
MLLVQMENNQISWEMRVFICAQLTKSKHRLKT